MSKYSPRPSGKVPLATGLVAVAGLTLLGSHLSSPGKSVRPAATPTAVKPVRQQLPLHFESNRGQTASPVQFLARGQGYTLFLTPREAVLSLAKKSPGSGKSASAILRTRFLGANPAPTVDGAEQLPGRVNYYLGKDPTQWRSNIPTFAKVRYQDLYQGVDLVYYGRQGELEYDFHVAPGADPGKIRLAMEGARDVRIDRSGDLILKTPRGEVRHQKPVVYQEVEGRRQPVGSRYVLLARADATHPAVVGFHTDAYRKDQALIIDPTLQYSTFFGGTGTDEANALAGNTIAGSTTSVDFPVYKASYPKSAGLTDAFVSAIDGDCLAFSTYLGGSGDDTARALMLTSTGYVVAGATSSPDFPTSLSSAQPHSAGGQDGFVAGLTYSGALTYGTYLGGSGTDVASALAQDTSGAVYVAGTTSSSNFPILNASQSTPGGGSTDAFVAKLAGGAVQWSTFYGGTGADSGNGIVLDSTSSPRVWLVGTTDGSVPAGSYGSFMASSPRGGATDGFLVTLNPSSSERFSRDYVGGGAADTALAIDADSQGYVYLTGQTSSSNFPTTSTTAVSSSLHGSADAYVTKLSFSAGMVYSSYLGDGGSEEGRAIYADKQLPGQQYGPINFAGHCYVGGSTSGGFATVGVDSGLGGGNGDGFVAHVDTTPNDDCYLRLWGATQLGGEYGDVVNAIYGSGGLVAAAGSTTSPGFPVTDGAYQHGLQGGMGTDAFLSKLNLNPKGPDAPTNLTAQTKKPASTVFIHLEWTNNAAAGSVYGIYRKSEFDSPVQDAQSIGSATASGGPGSTVTFDDLYPAANTHYTYYVELGNCYGPSRSNNASANSGVPKSPHSVTATALSSARVLLTWSDSWADADDFKIYRSPASSTPTFVLVGTIAQSAAKYVAPNGYYYYRYVDTGLTANTEYQYRIRGTNVIGESVDGGSPTNEAQVTTLTDTLAPAKPTEFTVEADGNQINLAWRDNSDNETGFQVQRRGPGDFDFNVYSTTAANATSFQDSSVSPGSTYTYRVRAVNTSASPTRYSAFTDELAQGVWFPAASAPCNVTATLVSGGVRLDWRFQGSSGTYFEIQRKLGGGTAATIATVYNPNVTFTDTTAYAGNTYTYYVVNVASSSSYSSAESSEPVTIVVDAPTAPSALTATKLSSTEVKLTWTDNSSNESSFVLERSVSGGAFSTLRTLGTNLTIHVDTGLDPQVRYQYRVKAVNVLGSSSYSNVVTVENPPTPPSGLTATAASSSQINLAWTDNSTNETGFKVERSTNGTTFSQLGSTTAANATSVSDSGLTADTTYYYRVCAVNAAGSSAYTAVASAATSLNPPSAPSGLTATAVSATQINLAWTDNSATENGFKVERSTDGTTYAQLGATTAANVTTFADTTVSPVTTYYYRVRATNSGGDSAATSVATATTPDVPPAAPSGLTATAVSSTQIDLSWTDNSANETWFTVQMSTSGGSFMQIGTTSANATTFSSLGLSAETTYTYRVFAANSAGQSGYSNQASDTTEPIDPEAIPTAPSYLSASPASQTVMNLHWTDQSNNETGFLVERSLDGTTFTQVGTTGANVTTYADSGLTASTQYYYRVRATNAGGNSAYSNTANGITLPNVPTAPSNLTATAVSPTQINLAWTDNSNNEQGFAIEQLKPNGSYAVVTGNSANLNTRAMVLLTPSTSYTFRVNAYNAGGNSAYTNTATATTLAPPPPAPTNVTVIAASQTQLNLSWTDNSSDETGFVVERLNSGSYVEVGTPSANATTFSDTGLTANTAYYYRIKAARSGVYSAYAAGNGTTLPNVPSAPTGLTVTVPAAPTGSTQLVVTWTDASNNETGFKLERSSDNFAEPGNTTLVASPAANAVSYTNMGLTANTTYYYRVRAVNSGGESANATAASGTTWPNPPSAPSGLTATVVSQTQINLSWTDTSGDETGFKVERSLNGSSFTQVGSTTAANVTTLSDTGLTAATLYYYRVRATNTGGDSSNASTNATTLPNAPAAPSTLVATVSSQTQINLTWMDNSNNETGFKVERMPSGGSYSQVGTPSANATSYSVTGLTANTAYNFRVRATNTGGDSSYSNVATATTHPTVPTAPSGLSVSVPAAPNGITKLVLTWTDASNNETGFQVERKPSGGSFSTVNTTAANATTYTDTGLTANTQYTYRVCAVNAGGASSYTSEASATTLPNPPSAPSAFVATVPAAPTGITTLRLVWVDNSNNETGFQIERKPSGGSFATIHTTAANVSSYDNTGLTANTQYTYRVCAVNTGGASSYTLESSATTLPNPPSAPSGLSVSVPSAPDGITKLALSWTDASGNETGFQVERKPSGGSFATVTTTAANATTYTDTGLTANTQYTYRVRAVNTGGASSYTSEASATTLPSPPIAPSGLSVSVPAAPDGITKLTLTWTDASSNETGFQVERKPSGGSFSTVTTTAANATTYTDTGLTANTQYTYRVCAVNTGGASSYTSEASATTLPNPPSAPSGLSVAVPSAPDGITKLTLTWTDASSNETGFQVERKPSGGSFTTATTTAANATTYTDTGLTANTQYTYRVRAVNTGGESSYTSEASATTLPTPPSAPTTLTAVYVPGSINLTWVDTSNNEAGFVIERKEGSYGFLQFTTLGANSTSYSNTGLTENTTYTYRVFATNAGGDSGYATSSSVTVPHNTPSELTATVFSNTRIDLTWVDNSSSETGYRIERSTSSSFPGGSTVVASVSPNVQSYSCTGLTNGTTYYFRVCSANFMSDFSNVEVSRTSVPADPTGLVATAVSSSQIDLVWNDNSNNETEYRILRSGNGTDYTLIATIPRNSSSYSATGLQSNKKYWFKVRAVNDIGNNITNADNATTFP